MNTVVELDEAALRVDTDAAGEPCIVSSDRARTSPRNAIVSSQLALAYGADPMCAVCNTLIVAIGDAAYITPRDRVVHRDRCLTRFMAATFGVRRASIGSVGDMPAIRAALEATALAEMEATIDRILDEPDYATLRAPVLFVGSQKCTFRRRALDLIDTSPPAIVIDMTDTRYVDTSALGALVSARHAYRRAMPSGRMFLVGVNNDIRTLLELTRLETMFDLVATFQEAEDAIRG